MVYRTRIKYTAAQRAEIWDRWQRGESLNSIGRLFDRPSFSIFNMLAKVNSKDTETVINALIKQAHKLPRELYKSLTWDRGCEMADHQRFTLATDIKVYFCDPQRPWQRGSN